MLETDLHQLPQRNINMKKYFSYILILSLSFTIALGGIFCSKSKSIEGDFRLSNGNYASKSLVIKNVSGTKYSVRYLDELSRGNKPQMLDAEQDGRKLKVQMHTMIITFVFSKNLDEFSFKQYGQEFSFKRKQK